MAAARAKVPWQFLISSRTASSMTMDPDLCYQEITVEDNNAKDILGYLRRGLRRLRSTAMTPADDVVWDELEHEMVKRADGVFLWAELVLENLYEKRDNGKTAKGLIQELQTIPTDLEALYERILQKATGDPSLRFFQWVVFCARPLTLSEWADALAFVYNPSEEAVSDWRDSPDYVDYDSEGGEDEPEIPVSRQKRALKRRDLCGKEEIMRRRIQSLSCGLVEVRHYDVEDTSESAITTSWDQNASQATIATAGSFRTGRAVRFIHGTVRDFFISGKGFSAIQPASIRSDALHNGQSHIFILQCCVTFAGTRVMKQLIEARADPIVKPEEAHGVNPKAPISRRKSTSSDAESVISFGSSAASSVGSSGDHAHNLWESYPQSSALAKLKTRVTKLGIRNQDTRLALWTVPDESLAARIQQYLELLPPDSLGYDFLKDGHTLNLKAEDSQRKTGKSILPLEIDEVLPMRAEYTESLQYWPMPSLEPPNSDTRRLRKFPSLAIYMVEMFDFHARVANEQGADPSLLIERLLNPHTWENWSRMRSSSALTSLMYFAASMNLTSWIGCLYSLGESPYHGWFTDTVIVATAEKDHVKAFNLLLDNYNNAITIAAKKGHIDAFNLLVDHYPRNHTSGVRFADYGPNFLHLACISLDIEFLVSIITCFKSPRPQKSSPSYPPPIWLAARLDEDGNTPLHLLVQNPAASAGIVQSYLDAFSTSRKRANQNTRKWKHDGTRPSLTSAEDVNLSKGADPNAQNANGDTPLSLACYQTPVDHDICRILLARGADPRQLYHKIKDSNGPARWLIQWQIQKQGETLRTLLDEYLIKMIYRERHVTFSV